MKQILYIAHGGGPMPLLGDRSHDDLNNALRKAATRMSKPTAIIVVSAHWETDVPHVTTGSQPELIYDYYGFPPESYTIQYPSPGAPELAEKVLSAITNQGLKAVGEPQRGFDHGLFVPLKIMYPAADIPCVQLSLQNTLNAEAHIKLGKALQAVDHDGLLILGSGFSFHNMRAFFAPDTSDADNKNAEFQAWLQHTCCATDISERERQQLLINWQQAPHARFCHPREEHLLPLHVCYGAAERACNQATTVYALNKESRMFYWQIN
ncbi:dioxygenase [Pseudidiomarina gelatinasegens]|uniref:Dioxygenase n=1 Tax=Pseudidiomarina gelatinasegens TaxID=2487740 RepID=A0A443YYH7_9GAMM|nr:class III extradiol ring-cleavage dioxygenase [Pseudidiomarina gelatinasegens]RWU09119.1 dioxygenase [Pseudidiomarina gelatinasegens]